MQVGSVNVVSSVIESELRIGTLERIVEVLLSKLSYTDRISQQEIDKIRGEVAKTLQNKYPDMGISFNAK